MSATGEERYPFPDPAVAPGDGPLAIGGDLEPGRILAAYRRGIFPWYAPGEPILWWSPDPRLLLYPGELKVSRSLRRVLRRGEYRVRFDRDFSAVIEACATIERTGQEGTWITPEMRRAYEELHRLGYAHSVEVYREGELVGGLYGIALGGAFFGESMFSRLPDTSKVALKALSDLSRKKGYYFIDCQVVTEHLLRMGARAVTRERFLAQLDEAMDLPDEAGSWSNISWEYKDEQRRA